MRCDSGKGIDEALFLKNYSHNITIINIGKKPLLASNAKTPIRHLKIISHKIDEVILKNNVILAFRILNQTYFFDVAYSALGVEIRSSLAIKLGAKHNNFYLETNEKQETSVKGIYAVGDVVEGLNQMCVAFSHAAVAATAIFRKLKNLE